MSAAFAAIISLVSGDVRGLWCICAPIAGWRIGPISISLWSLSTCLSVRAWRPVRQTHNGFAINPYFSASPISVIIQLLNSVLFREYCHFQKLHWWYALQIIVFDFCFLICDIYTTKYIKLTTTIIIQGAAIVRSRACARTICIVCACPCLLVCRFCLWRSTEWPVTTVEWPALYTCTP